MNELIKITYDGERPTVSARELHEFLEVMTQFSIWFERMSAYGFVEHTDYEALNQKRLTAQGNETEFIDYQLTVEMAKELCMIQRNEKGKQARTYFIQLEKDWNSPDKVMARALKLADQTIHNLTTKIETDKPKVLFADAVETAHTSILVGDLAKLIKQNDVEIGQKRLFQWLRNNGYLMKSGESYNMPTQYSMERGLFEIKERTINNPDGSVIITRTVKVTGKGQTYFVNKFLKERDVT